MCYQNLTERVIKEFERFRVSPDRIERMYETYESVVSLVDEHAVRLK